MDNSIQNIASIFGALKGFKQTYGMKQVLPDTETLTAHELFVILDAFIRDTNNYPHINLMFFRIHNEHTPISAMIGSYYQLGNAWNENCFNALLTCDLVTYAKNKWVVTNISETYSEQKTLIKYLEAKDLASMGEIFANLIRHEDYKNNIITKSQLSSLLNLLVLCNSLEAFNERVKKMTTLDMRVLLHMARKEAAVTILLEGNKDLIESKSKEALITKILENDDDIALVLLKAAIAHDEKGAPCNPLSAFFDIQRGYTAPTPNNGTRLTISNHIKKLEAIAPKNQNMHGLFKNQNSSHQPAATAYTPS